jgi:hypothetical protein
MERRTFVLFAAASLSACNRYTPDDPAGGEDLGTAEEAIDASETSTDAAALVAVVAPGSINATAHGAAADAAAKVSCPGGGEVTATTSGAVVTYHFEACTLPYGLVRVTGDLVATYSPHGASLDIALDADDLAIDGAIIDLDVDATLTVDNVGDRVLEVTSDIEGTGRLGREIHHAGDFTARYAAEGDCVGVDGAWSTEGGDYTTATSVSGFERCAAQCPSAGAHIELSLPSRTVTLAFDGSEVVSWSSTRGTEGTITLPYCEPT